MFLDVFFSNSQQHLRRAAVLLQEANMARIEHQAAAEHHGALAKMYAERARRLDREVHQLMPMSGSEHGASGESLAEQPVLLSLHGNRRAKTHTSP